MRWKKKTIVSLLLAVVFSMTFYITAFADDIGDVGGTDQGNIGGTNVYTFSYI